MASGFFSILKTLIPFACLMASDTPSLLLQRPIMSAAKKIRSPAQSTSI